MTVRIVLVVALVLIAAAPWRAAQAGERDPHVTLGEVAGAKAFPGDDAARAKLERTGFVVLPRIQKQIFTPYIGGDLPPYVTTDSAHATYHALFEDALAELERVQARRWGPLLVAILDAVLEVPVPEGPWRTEARTMAAERLAVAATLLGESVDVSSTSNPRIAAEVAAVEDAAGPDVSPLHGGMEDYAQYVPRGLYEGDEALERWFRAMQWLGRTPFRVENATETRAAILIARAVATQTALVDAFRKADDVYGWLLGPADDLTIAEYMTALEGIDPVKDLPAATKRLRALRDPEINDQLLAPDAWRAFQRTTKGLRLWPKRRVADAWLAQQLMQRGVVQGAVGGLEVAAALGSSRARAHLGGPKAGPTRAAIDALAAPFRERLVGTQYGDTLALQASLFDPQHGIHGTGAAKTGAKGAPDFRAAWLRDDPWKDRVLTTGLAGWTSLRHAWVLHAKASAFYLGATEEQPGVVEPAAAYYRGLATLARGLQTRFAAAGVGGSDAKAVATRLARLLRIVAQQKMPSADDMAWLQTNGDALEPLFGEGRDRPPAWGKVAKTLEGWVAGTGTLTPAQEAALAKVAGASDLDKLEDFAALMDDLVVIAEHHLAGKALTGAQEELILEYGKTIADFQGFHGNSWLSPQRQMGLVVDVASDPSRGTHRHAAVGGAMELYVVLPLHGGGHQLYRGGVYSYYAFDEAKPLTDSAWRARVRACETPPLPAWTSSYVAAADVDGLVRAIRAGKQPERIREVNDDRVAEALLQVLTEAPLEDARHDKHLAWVAEHLERYAAGPCHAAIRDALLARLLTAKGEEPGSLDQEEVFGDEQLGAFTQAGAQVLGRILDDGGRALIAQRLIAPPAGSHANARARMGRALMAGPPATLPSVAGPLLKHAEPDVRRWAMLLLSVPHRYKGERIPAEPAALLASALAGETVPRNQVALMNALLDVLGTPHIHGFRRISPAAHAAAKPAAAPAAALLGSKDADVREAAITVLGTIGDKRYAPQLLAGLRAAKEDRMGQAWAWGLGHVLAGVEAPYGAMTQAMLDEALAQFEQGARKDSWHTSVGCMEGLVLWGSKAALAVFERLMLDRKFSTGLRHVGIHKAERLGKAAVPLLLRLTFDETETGDSTNDHQLRICDEAMKALHAATEGELGWMFQIPDDAETRAKDLAAVRAEARKRGLGP